MSDLAPLMNAWSHSPSPYAPPGWSHPSSYPPPPYAPPASPHAEVSGPTASTVLYTPGQIMLATFLGAPLAGAVLLAVNEQRLGRPKGVLWALALGFALTILVVGVAVALPDNVPGLPLSLLGMGALRAVAHMKQAEAVTRHLHWGGRKGSSWAAAGIGVLSSVLVVGVVFVIAVAYYVITGKEVE